MPNQHTSPLRIAPPPRSPSVANAAGLVAATLTKASNYRTIPPSFRQSCGGFGAEFGECALLLGFGPVEDADARVGLDVLAAVLGAAVAALDVCGRWATSLPSRMLSMLKTATDVSGHREVVQHQRMLRPVAATTDVRPRRSPLRMNIPDLDPEVLARIDARVARDGLPSREAAFAAALREWAPTPNESMLSDTADAFIEAIRNTARPDRYAAANRIFDVVIERMGRINAVAPHDRYPSRCAHHCLTKFEGSPTSKKNFRTRPTNRVAQALGNG
jgi:hypothetical protein